MNPSLQKPRLLLLFWGWSLIMMVPVSTSGDTVEIIGTRQPIPHEVRVTPTESVTAPPTGVSPSTADWNPQQPPRFEQYPVEQVFTGTPAPVVITPERNSVGNRIRGMEAAMPNFAGHYRLTLWGHGAGCVTGAVVDVQNGQRYPLPDAICGQPKAGDENFQPLEFQPDSDLLIVQGRRDKRDGDSGRHYYRFENGRFVYLGSVQPE